MKAEEDGHGKVLLGADGSAAILPIGSLKNGVFIRRAIDHFTVNARGMILYNAPNNYWR